VHRAIALFDFDGTVTTRDSLTDFIAYSVGYPKLLFGICSLVPIFAAYKMNVIPNDRAKEKLISYFFEGWEFTRFLQIASLYSKDRLPLLIKSEMLEKIKWHKHQDHEVVVVTASLEHYIEDWCNAQQVSLIGTQLEVRDGRVTGRLATSNCFGIEKARRIRERFSLPQYDYIYAYGDSRGDREMLDLAHEKYYREVRVP
jgi:phosphatidylglycerophosphatase C